MADIRKDHALKRPSIMPSADGFATIKPKSARSRTIAAPRFESAFASSGAGPSRAEADSASSAPSPAPARKRKLALTYLPQFSGLPETTNVNADALDPRKRARKPDSAGPSDRQKPRSSTGLKVLKPPVLSHESQREKPDAIRRPPSPAPSTPLRPSRPVPKFIIPPITSSNATTSSRPLKPAPPPPPVSATKHGTFSIPTKLVPLSETRVARATDLSSSQGPARLLSIMLQDQQHTETLAYASIDPAERERGRGLIISPEKGEGRKGGAKFLRNGLAERASQYLTRSQTATSLWHSSVQPSTTTSSSSARRSTPAPDVCLRIRRVLHVSRQAEGFGSLSPAPRAALLRCRVLSGSVSSGAGGTGVQAPRYENIGKQDVLVLLSFVGHGGAFTAARVADGLEEGVEVRIWRPFFKVSLSVDGDAGNGRLAEPHSETVRKPLPMPPLSFPDTPESASASQEERDGAPQLDRAVLCTRFLVCQADVKQEPDEEG